MNFDELRQWIGRTETRHESIALAALTGFHATLDKAGAPPETGDAIAPLSHWLFFNAVVPAREIGPDGHPKRGGFLPPVPLPRRMWAGGRLDFHAPIAIGAEATRESTIKDVQVKQGKSGALVFVTLRHEIAADGTAAISEEHDIVYREAPTPGAVAPGAPITAALDRRAGFSRTIHPDPVLLFRYSALTFNGHRIHYDQPYVTQVEGYPGLIVHGPLIATLLVDLLMTTVPDATLRHFEFKAVSPIFDTHDFKVCGIETGAGRYSLWAETPDGRLAMDATALTERP